MQGYDAYALSVDGKSLHTAVAFLLDAVDNPSVVLGYAAETPENCTGAPPFPALELTSVVDAPGGFNYSAWLEPYIARFPSHPNTPRLRNLIRGGLDPHRPLYHPHSGGNTTCFSAGAKLDPIVAPGSSIEYFNGSFGHYFITNAVDEIDGLDAGVFAGWSRTGESFKTFPLHAEDTASVCRFFTTHFAPKSSHFYTPVAAECAWVKQNPVWQFEAEVFGWKLPSAGGACATGTIPLYRLYNDGRTGAPNHRYTIRPEIRTQMLNAGFVSEGVIGCVPE